MNGLIVAATAGATSLAGAAVGVVAQATGGTSDLPFYASAGGSTVAVSALAYVVKKVLAGELIPRPVAEYQRELSAMIAATAQREAETMRIAEQYRKDNEATRRLMAKIDRHLGGPDDRTHPRREPGS